ncbi:MAG TPA: hypothetical protein VF060_17275 [Trebonia sp.]
MPDKVTISHRGARYQIGRGKRYYGIWVAGAPESDPVDRWPETQDGWTQAWTRFVALETPGTIAAAERSGFTLPRIRLARPAGRASGTAAIVAAALLGLGVILGIVGLFPNYSGGQSLAAQADQWVPHLLYLIGWAVSGALILAGARRGRAGGSGWIRAGALIGTGLSAVTLGLFLSDLGQVVSAPAGAGISLGAGLVLSIIGWAACAAGSVTGLVARGRPAAAAGETTAAGGTAASADTISLGQTASPGDTISFGQTASPGDTISLGETVLPSDATLTGNTIPASAPAAPAGAPSSANTQVIGRPVRPRPEHFGPIALLVLGALGAVFSFAPSWDSYTLQSAAGTQTITAGNAFSNPGPVIAGDVIVMVAVVLVALTAALWRPMRQGSALLAGAIIPMVAQAISALIQVGQPTSPLQFGITPAQASAAHLTITSGVTPVFWVYCVFVIALVISCAWLLTEPGVPATPAPVPAPWGAPVPPGGGDNRESGSRDSGGGPEGGEPEDDAENSYA